MCQTQSISRYSPASKHASKPSENGKGGLKTVPRLWPSNILLQPGANKAEKTLMNEYCDQKVEFGSYGVHVKQENSSDIIFNDSTEMNSECESTEQNYVIKDYKLQEKDGDDDLLPSPESKPTPESIHSFEPNFDPDEDQELPRQTLGKRERSKEGQDDGNETTFQLLRDAEAEEFIKILLNSNSAKSLNYDPSLSDGSLCSFDRNSILSDDNGEPLQSAENFSQSADPCDREQNFDGSSPAQPAQEIDLQKVQNAPKLDANINSELKLQKPARLGLADASRRFVTFCKAKKSFRSITEVAAEILIDRKRLYDIANIFQELDIISKYEDTFYFNSSDKIIPLVIIQQRISVFERKGSVTSLPCTALLIIRHFVVGDQNGYTADELVDAVHVFYAKHPKCECQKKNTIKRRVYDSLNILQGVDMITKESVKHGIFRFHLILERT